MPGYGPLLGEDMARVERAGAGPPPSKVLSLVEMIEQAKERLAVGKPDAEPGRKPEP